MKTSRTLFEMRERLFRNGGALLPLRLLVGFGFAAHGYAKLDRGVESFAVILRVMGILAPGFAARATALLELIGGIALMAGVAVAPLCAAFVVVMLGALFGVHLRYGFSSVRLKALTPSGAEFGPVGYELNLLYIVALVALASSKPGPLSVSRWLEARRARRAGGAPSERSG